MTTPGQSGTDFGHVHIGACLPSEQRVSGTVHLDIRVIVHDGQGATFDRIEPVIKTDAIETTLGSYIGCKGTTIEHGTVTCWQGLDIDTTRYDVDGRNELRLRAWSRTPDGNQIHVSLNTMWDVRNGKFAVLDPLNGSVRAGNMWSAAGATRAAIAGLLMPAIDNSPAIDQAERFREQFEPEEDGMFEEAPAPDLF